MPHDDDGDMRQALATTKRSPPKRATLAGRSDDGLARRARSTGSLDRLARRARSTGSLDGLARRARATGSLDGLARRARATGSLDGLERRARSTGSSDGLARRARATVDRRPSTVDRRPSTKSDRVAEARGEDKLAVLETLAPKVQEPWPDNDEAPPPKRAAPLFVGLTTGSIDYRLSTKSDR